MNDKPTPLNFAFKRNLFGFGMKSALTERATEPWPKGVHPKEAEVRKDAELTDIPEVIQKGVVDS